VSWKWHASIGLPFEVTFPLAFCSCQVDFALFFWEVIGSFMECAEELPITSVGNLQS
jgi:hypothetical protein